MTWADDVRRANEALDWIEARQGPLKPEGYARIETDVRTVRAMAMAEGQDDKQLAEIRARLAAAEAALRASQGIIHEGLHGGRPTVPEHQERCEKPACRRIRAALAGSRERAQGEGE